MDIPVKPKILIKGISYSEPVFYRQEPNNGNNEVTSCRVTYYINTQKLVWDGVHNFRAVDTLNDNLRKIYESMLPKKKKNGASSWTFYNQFTITSVTKRKDNDPNDWDTAERITKSKCNAKILKIVNRALKMTIKQLAKNTYILGQISDKVYDATNRETDYVTTLSTKHDK